MLNSALGLHRSELMESFARTENGVPEITLAMSEALAKDLGSCG
jgi:hypothetical protein